MSKQSIISWDSLAGLMRRSRAESAAGQSLETRLAPYSVTETTIHIPQQRRGSAVESTERSDR